MTSASRTKRITAERAPSLSPRMRAYNGIYRTAFRYPPYNLDQLTQQQGYDAAEKMLTMGACRSPFNLKRYAVQCDGWEIAPAITDAFDSRFTTAKEYADFVRWAFSTMMAPSGYPQDMMTAILENSRGMWEGFRVGEILLRYQETGPYAGKYGLRGIAWKPAKQTGFDYDPETQEPNWVTSYTPGGSVIEGDPSNATRVKDAIAGGYDFTVPVDSCLIYSYGTDAGVINTPGDWRGCYKNWFRLDNNLRFWAIALERWGSPVLIAQANTNNQPQMEAAQATLDAISKGGSPIVPNSISYQLATVQGTVFDGFLKSCQWDEEQIAKNIHSNTLSTDTTGGTNTNALGNVHQESGETVYGYARRTIENAWTLQVIDRLLAYNVRNYDPTLRPRLSLGGDKTDDILDLMTAFDLAINDGLVWKGEKWIRERLGWQPLTPEDQKAQLAERQAEQEAQQRLADARNSGQAARMHPTQVERALEILTMAVKARQYVQGAEAQIG
jgi:hypothetical protein